MKKFLKFWLGFRWIFFIQRRFQFVIDYFHFSILNKADSRFSSSLIDLYPCLNDNTNNTGFDAHYLYHPAWAIRKVKEINPPLHYDFSSILSFSAALSAFIPVKFYDYRPADISLSNLENYRADLVNLQFPDNSLHSISCMHTIEHIGLGRYGDRLDPLGDIKAINELKRVCADNGYILFVTPVGKPKIMYNAHRIYSYEMIKDYFNGFELIEFSLVTDNDEFQLNAPKELVQQQNYGCGCFLFKKSLDTKH